MSLKNWLHQTYLKLGFERDSLMVINFHEIFQNEHERDTAPLRVGQGMTVAGIRRVLNALTSAGYQSIRPDQLNRDHLAEDRYLLITMDDAYYHHKRLVPLLEEFEIHAVFFVPVDYVRSPRKFWWDAVHCAMSEEGFSDREISGRIQSYKQRPVSAIESGVVDEFGADVLTPEGELDRPFTAEELKGLMDSPYVHLGNHMVTHNSLTEISIDQCRDEIREGRRFLVEIDGRSPRMVAYPFGDYNSSVVEAVREEGVELGFTESHKKNYIPPMSENTLELGRFPIWGEQPLQPQLTSIRSDLKAPWWLN